MGDGTTPHATRPWFRGSKKRWYVTIDGEQISLGVPGPKSPASEAKAWEVLNAMLAEVRQQVEVLRATAPGESRGSLSRATAVTVAEAAAAWLAESCVEVAASTAAIYRRHAKAVVAALGTRVVDAGLTVAQVRASSQKATWSSSTRRSYLDAATAILYAAGWPHVFKKKPPKVSAGDGSVYTPEQHEAILDVMTGDMRPYLRVLWELGSRPQELAGLILEKVQWEDGIAVLKEHKNKRHGRKRTLYFTPSALQILRRQQDRYKSGLAFRNQKGEKFSVMAMVKRMNRAGKKLGIKATAYGYRHTFVTRMLLKGVTAAQVAELVGTSVQMIARHYGHLESSAGLMREVLLKAADNSQTAA